MTGPNTDGCEQFGDYDEAEYNRQMMVAEIHTCHQALQKNSAEIISLKSENAGLKRLLRQTLTPANTYGITWEMTSQGGQLESMTISLPGSWVHEVQKAVGEPMPEGVDNGLETH